jgi:DNA-binding HxlR family transcriptional regulator
MRNEMHNCNENSCPIIIMVDLLEKKWAMRIIKEIYHGNTHFNEIKRKMKGITPAVLSKRLKELEKAKLLTKKTFAKSKIVEYRLGPQAQHLMGCWDHHTVKKTS